MKKILSIFAVTLALGAGGAMAQGPYPNAMTDGTYGPVGVATPNSNSGPNGSVSEFELYNAVNQLLGTSYTNNAQLGTYEVNTYTKSWQQNNNGDNLIIGLGAANANTLEVYNAATPGTLTSPFGGSFSGNGPTGDGSQANPYIGTPSSFAPGTQFGFALNTVGTNNINQSGGSSNNTWYSDPSLNSDLMDHTIIYNLSGLSGTQVYMYDPTTGTESQVTLQNPYLVGFEDLPTNPTGNSDLDYNDMVFLVSGASPTAPVPEPMTWALFAVGLGAMAFTLRRSSIGNFKLGF